GPGAILAEIEALKVRLRAEGIFDLQRDKSLPALPRHLGVVTSPSGSVIRDIMHRVADRCPLPVTIWPAAVQGGACPTDIVRGIEGFNTVPESGCFTRPDLIIVARGGGSFEDLLGFNDESVVRAAANSEIPLIAAIGHETDTTLIDSAATRSAPTPTAAVELALPVLADLRRRIQESRQIIIRNWCGDLKKSQQRVVDIGKRIPNTDSVLARETQHYDMLAERIPRSLGISLDTRRNGITLLNQRLHAPGLMTRLHERLAISRRQIRPEMIHRCLTGLQDILVQKTQDVNSAVETVMAQRSAHQGNLRRLLDTLGYRNTLRRGYAVIRENGTIRDSRSAVQDPSGLEIEFHDGRISLQDTAET
ncbi:MAG: exodeoxyribonuclease VII large subunit, partial [Rhodobacteraceae bacterium]|nr:exodeoxyribonuclease VII large subunit [Paracoccaceae bacterium]